MHACWAKRHRVWVCVCVRGWVKRGTPLAVGTATLASCTPGVCSLGVHIPAPRPAHPYTCTPPRPSHQAEVPKIPDDEMLYVQQMLSQLQKSQAAQKAQAQAEPEEAQPPVRGAGRAPAALAALRQPRPALGGRDMRCGHPPACRCASPHAGLALARVCFAGPLDGATVRLPVCPPLAGPDRRVDPVLCGPAQGALRHRPRQAARVPGGGGSARWASSPRLGPPACLSLSEVSKTSVDMLCHTSPPSWRPLSQQDSSGRPAHGPRLPCAPAASPPLTPRRWARTG